MAAYLALLIGFGLVLWLMREDIKTRRAGSQALLIPGLWVCIQATHPLSFWFTGAEGAGDALFDTALSVAMMVASIVVIKRRGLKWGKLANQNTALFLIYGYFALSAIWSDAPVLSIKRIIKDFGVLPVALVFLTELKPAEAIRVVFVRIAYILFPLSIVAIKWFPAIGRVARNSGDSMFRGLTLKLKDYPQENH